MVTTEYMNINTIKINKLYVIDFINIYVSI